MKQGPDRDEIIRTIIRFIDDYGWSRTVVKKVINRKFGTRYFEQKYKAKKIFGPKSQCFQALRGPQL